MAKIKTNNNQYFMSLIVGSSFVFGMFLGYIFFGESAKSQDKKSWFHEDIDVVLPSVVISKKKLYNVSNQSPEKFLATMQSALIKAAKEDDFEVLEDLFRKHFAMEYAAKVVLGGLWHSLDKKFKDDFLLVFSSYVSGIYYSYVKEIIKHADDIVIQSASISVNEDIYKGRMIIVRNTENNISVGFTIKKIDSIFQLIDFTAFRMSFAVFLRKLLKPHVPAGISSIIEFLSDENKQFVNANKKSIK